MERAPVKTGAVFGFTCTIHLAVRCFSWSSEQLVNQCVCGVCGCTSAVSPYTCLTCVCVCVCTCAECG